jgi:hypothetical protein
VTPPHHEQTTPDAVLAPNLLPSIEDESEESENDGLQLFRAAPAEKRLIWWLKIVLRSGIS